MYSEDLIKEAVQKEMDNYNNNNQYPTVNKDGKKMAVIDADQLEDGLIIVPGNGRQVTSSLPPHSKLYWVFLSVFIFEISRDFRNLFVHFSLEVETADSLVCS